MAIDPKLMKSWNTLRAAWQEANQNARAARAGVTAAYARCAANQGSGPAVTALEEVERLEKLADGLSIEMDNFVKNAL